MKKMMLMLVLCIGAGFSTYAQKNPPQVVVNAFNQKFSNAKELEWKLEKNGEWEAEFEQDEEDMSANFSADGKWIETEVEIAVSELPQGVRDYVATNFKDKKIKEAARITRADGTTMYEAEVKGQGDLLFDSAGKLVEQAEKD